MKKEKEAPRVKLPLRYAEVLGENGINRMTLSKINRGLQPSGLRLSAQICRVARDTLGYDVDIIDWRPDLMDSELWKEIVYAVQRRIKQEDVQGEV